MISRNIGVFNSVIESASAREIRGALLPSNRNPPPQLLEPREVDFDKAGGPLPRVISRRNGQNPRASFNDAKTGRSKKRWKIQGNIRLASGCSPALHYFIDETLQSWTARRQTPGPVVHVFVKDRDTTWTKRAGDLLDEFLRRRNK